eukprot:Rmarinus@m.464
MDRLKSVSPSSPGPSALDGTKGFGKGLVTRQAFESEPSTLPSSVPRKRPTLLQILENGQRAKTSGSSTVGRGAAGPATRSSPSLRSAFLGTDQSSMENGASVAAAPRGRGSDSTAPNLSSRDSVILLVPPAADSPRRVRRVLSKQGSEPKFPNSPSVASPTVLQGRVESRSPQALCPTPSSNPVLRKSRPAPRGRGRGRGSVGSFARYMESQSQTHRSPHTEVAKESRFQATDDVLPLPSPPHSPRCSVAATSDSLAKFSPIAVDVGADWASRESAAESGREGAGVGEENRPNVTIKPFTKRMLRPLIDAEASQPISGSVVAIQVDPSLGVQLGPRSVKASEYPAAAVMTTRSGELSYSLDAPFDSTLQSKQLAHFRRMRKSISSTCESDSEATSTDGLSDAEMTPEEAQRLKARRGSLAKRVAYKNKKVLAGFKAEKVSFYGKREKRVFAFDQLGGWKHQCLSYAAMVSTAVVALIYILFYRFNLVAAATFASVVDTYTLSVVMLDWETMGWNRAVKVASLAVAICVPITYVFVVTFGVGMRILLVTFVMYVTFRVTKSPVLVRFRYFMGIMLLTTVVINLSSMWYASGEFAISTGPVLMSVAEGLSRLLIKLMVRPGTPVHTMGDLIAAASVGLSIWFAGIRLALFLVAWQTSHPFTVFMNMFLTVVSEAVVEGGVLQIYVYPYLRNWFPVLKKFYNEITMQCLLVYVSAAQVTEYTPAVVTFLVYLIYGNGFKVTGLLLAEVDQYPPYQERILLALLFFLIMEMVISLLCRLVSLKTGFRHAWVWNSRRVAAFALHEALHYGVCPLLTAVVMSEVQEDGDQYGSAADSPVETESVISTLAPDTATNTVELLNAMSTAMGALVANATALSH